MNLKDIEFMSASKFTRLNTEQLKKLPPITLLLDGANPICVAINYATFLQLQNEWKAASGQAVEWKRRAAQHGCNVEEGDHECG